MSVIIKSRQVKFRNTGSEDYHGISAISEEKTTDMLQQIEQKGQEVRDSIPENYTELADKVTDLKTDFNNLSTVYVSLDGENQVTPQNISGVTFTKTETEIPGDNIFDASTMLFEDNYYVNINTRVTPPIITHSYSTNYITYVLPVEADTKYTFTQARFAALSKGNTLASQAVGSLLTQLSSVETADASYLFLTYQKTVASIEVHKITKQMIYSDFVMPDWMGISKGDTKPKYKIQTGAFTASGDNIIGVGARSDLRKGVRVVFEATISGGTDFEIGFSINDRGVNSPHNVISITDTNVSYARTSYAHGLTITGRIQFILEYLSDATAKLTLLSNGQSYTTTVSFVSSNPAVPFVRSNGMIATDCKLMFTCVDFTCPIWIFGDSYVQYSSTRWAYYLHEYGYDEGVLINGFSGEGSVNARVSFINLLNFGTPKYAIWCLGMNDGSDQNDTTPTSAWVSGRDYFIGYCNANKITPIFGTIPNVPNINHKAKNAWIRSSGYTYIDFDHAVGADVTANWYPGMLSDDNVHPTANGAKALFAQVLLDFPQIMLK